MNVLLGFSGGVDSTAAAIVLANEGHDVTLGHLVWVIEGTHFGQRQTRAAHHLSHELGMPLEVLAYLKFPASSFAKYSWVPIAISTIMHHAGDPCVYPAHPLKRYDAVAFGTDFLEVPEHNNTIRRWWLRAMQDYIYRGEVLYPLEGMERRERSALVPQHMLDLTVACYLGPADGSPCGECYKCIGD